MIKIYKFVFNIFQENTFLACDSDSEACAIIDPGCSSGREREILHNFIEQKGLKPCVILLTHAHMDHMLGVKDCVERYSIPVYMNHNEIQSIEGYNPSYAHLGFKAEPMTPYIDAEDGCCVEMGSLKARALFTPGHSMGGLCWWFEKEGIIFTGDTLFAGCIGRTDNKWASLDILKKSLNEVLMTLDGEIEVYPGHGPSTTIGHERLTNPFINEQFGDLGYEN